MAAVTTWIAWVLFASALLARPSTGQVYAWRDEHGVTHFTNLREEIPEAQRASAREVVSALWSQGTSPAQAETEGKPEANAGARVVVVPPPLPQPRAEGWPREERAAAVNIQGPLAVAIAQPSAPPVAWPAIVAAPFVTTAFDFGHSRHRTLRLLADGAWVASGPWPLWPGTRPPCPYPVLTFAGGPRYSCLQRLSGEPW